MYKLVRRRDGLTKEAPAVKYIDFNEKGTFKGAHDDIKVGRSLIMSPFNRYFTWQTTLITEIIEKKKKYVKFKTENSEYTLFYPET